MVRERICKAQDGILIVVCKWFRQGAAVLLLLAAVFLLSGSANRFPDMNPWLAIALNVAADHSKAPVCATGDLDGDGITEEYSLAENILTVTSGGQTIWQSPRDYSVDSFALGDIDNDGKANLVISLWKEGSFGEMRPFWHSNEDTEYKNHLFVYEMQDNALTQVWCSSNLDHPIQSFEIKDVNGDSRNELVTKEGEYREICDGRYVSDPESKTKTTVWEWEEWGFQLCDDLGIFSSKI